MHEEVWRGTTADAAAHFATNEPIGEFVVVIEGAPPVAPADEEQITRAVDAALGAGMSVRDAADHVSNQLDVPRRSAYRVALSRRSSGDPQ